MLSLASLLNPTAPGPPVVSRIYSSPTATSPTTSYTEGSPPLSRSLMPKFKMPRESTSVPRPKPRGAVMYSPFEQLDEFALHEIRKFHVHPFGRIREQCSHIPYNSGKKDFFEKTGRESFEGRHASGSLFGDVLVSLFVLFADYSHLQSSSTSSRLRGTTLNTQSCGTTM